MDRYVLISGGLLLFALAFIFGISLGIPNKNVRTGARIASVVPAIVAFFMLKPGQFESDPYNLSTSQFIGLLSAVLVAYFYAKLWEEARKNPKQAMALGLPNEGKEKKKKKAAPEPEPEAEEEEEEDEEEEEEAKKPAEKPAKKPAKDEEEEEDDEEEEEGEPEPA
jgi:phosphatidylglycerol:prolipoprotein diacylglycerol transferase